MPSMRIVVAFLLACLAHLHMWLLVGVMDALLEDVPISFVRVWFGLSATLPALVAGLVAGRLLRARRSATWTAAAATVVAVGLELTLWSGARFTLATASTVWSPALGWALGSAWGAAAVACAVRSRRDGFSWPAQGSLARDAAAAAIAGVAGLVAGIVLVGPTALETRDSVARDDWWWLGYVSGAALEFGIWCTPMVVGVVASRIAGRVTPWLAAVTAFVLALVEPVLFYRLIGVGIDAADVYEDWSSILGGTLAASILAWFAAHFHATPETRP